MAVFRFFFLYTQDEGGIQGSHVHMIHSLPCTVSTCPLFPPVVRIPFHLAVRECEDMFSRLWVECQRCQGSLHQDVLCTRWGGWGRGGLLVAWCAGL